MRKARLFVALAVTAAMLVGCGKDAEAVRYVEQNEETAYAAAKSDEETKASKLIKKDKIEAILPEFTILSESTLIEDEDEIYIVGTMQGEYLCPTEETEEEYPDLCEAIEEFNEQLKDDYDEAEPDFSDFARESYAKMLEENPDEDYGEGLRYMYSLHVMRADEDYTSFYARADFDFNEDAAEQYYYVYNFDSQTGEAVDVTDIILDADEFNEIVKSCFEEKYGAELEFDVYDEENPDTLNWCLTPIGINVYFDNDGFDPTAKCGMYVNIDFDTYFDIIDYDYMSNSDDYVYPFEAGDELCVDVDDDGEANIITFDPIIPEDEEETNDREGYTVSVDGEVYDDFDETWFMDCYPYYVHNSEGNFIMVELVGYEGNCVDIIAMDDGEPEYVKSVSANKLGGEREVDEDLYSQYRCPAFTNSSILLDFDFADLISGPYIITDEYAIEDFDEDEYSDEDEEDFDEEEDYEEGERVLEFYEVDGRLYAEYMSDFYYGASEIELMDPKPEKVDDDYIFSVRFHYFSSFSFAGDYHGGGYICDVTVHDDGSLTISENNPFEEGYEIELEPFYDADIHAGMMEYSEWNTECFECEGSWRYQGISDYDEVYEYYLELKDDGTAYFYIKNDTYPINLNIGIYTVEEGDNEDEYVITFDGETMGYACMPCDTLTFVYNIEDDTLTSDASEYSDDDLTIEYWRTTPGDWAYAFGDGPSTRTDELLEDWNEYLDY